MQKKEWKKWTKDGRQQARKAKRLWDVRRWIKIKNRPCVWLFGLSWDPRCTNSHSCYFPVIFSLDPLLSSSQMLLFCPALRPGAAMRFQHSGVLITGSHVSCSHLSPSTSSPFHFPAIDILSLSLSQHMEWFFKREPSPHQGPRLSGSICCSFSKLFPQRTLPAPQPIYPESSTVPAQNIYLYQCYFFQYSPKYTKLTLASNYMWHTIFLWYSRLIKAGWGDGWG